MALNCLQILNTFPKIKDDSDLELYVEMARLQTSKRFYGEKYEMAVALRAAHNLAMSKPTVYSSVSSIKGGQASRRLEDQSESFYDGRPQLAGGRVSAGNKLLSMTVYGQQLIQLMVSSNTTMGVTGAYTSPSYKEI